MQNMDDEKEFNIGDMLYDEFFRLIDFMGFTERQAYVVLAGRFGLTPDIVRQIIDHNEAG